MTDKCTLCDAEVIEGDNYIDGVWCCCKCYPKFKIVFNKIIKFCDLNKIEELRNR